MDSAIEINYVQVPPQRQANDSAGSPSQFSQGVMLFQFNVGKGQCIFWDRSYFTITAELKGSGVFTATNSKPSISELIALSDNWCGNLFDSCYVNLGGQSVSNITNYLAQANALDTRVNSSQAWLKSIGQSASYDNANFSSRVNATSAQLVAPTLPRGANADPNLVECRGFSGLSLEEGKTCYRKPILPTATLTTATLTALDPSETFTGTGTALSTSDIGSTIVISGTPATIVRVVTAEGGATQLIAIDAPITGFITAAVTADWYLIQRNLTTSTEGHNYVQGFWQPTMCGIFKHHEPMGAMDAQIMLNPSASYKLNAVESVPGYAGSDFQIKSINFYACVGKMVIPDTVQTLFLDEYMLQSRTCTTNDVNTNLTVPPSTDTIYVWLQSGKTGQSVLFPPSSFKAEGNAEQNISRLQLTYANQTKPSVVWQSEYTNNIGNNLASRNVLTQFYTQSLLETDRYFDNGGAESFNDWLARGCLFAFHFEKAKENLATQLQLQALYSDPTGTNADGVVVPFPTDSRIFVAAKYSRTVEVVTAGGMVTNVRSLNV
jgi:hypothetical protein